MDKRKRVDAVADEVKDDRLNIARDTEPDETFPLNPQPCVYADASINNNNEKPKFTYKNMDDKIGGDKSTDLIIPKGLKRHAQQFLSQPSSDVIIRRPALTVARKHEKYLYQKPHKSGFRESIAHSAKKKTECSKKRVIDTLYLRLPILDWLLHYKISKDLFSDVISGITVAVMHIPQGMAYGMLANLDPINGIYMGFFPVLIYAAFASSRHCSIGTFAVVCIMNGKVVAELSTTAASDDPFNLFSSNATTIYTPSEVASILSFAVGIWMLLFGVCHVGSLCVFLSDMLVSGFTTGASIHVLTSQVPKLLGVGATRYQGIFKIPKIWYSIFANILDSNFATMINSSVCLFILILSNEVLKPRLQKLTKIPLPIELIVVIGGTLVSMYGHLNENFGVEVVGDIPTGFPSPKIPPFELYGKLIFSSLTIAIVSYTSAFSMAKIFAKRLDYTVDATQELYAIGLGNLMGSMFSCAPIAASLSRSLIQQTVGGITQLASYISCSLLIFLMLFIGPFFEPLPTCVLGATVVVALKGLFLQVFDFSHMWKMSRVDAFVWLISFLGVIILDIDYGLLIGIFASLLLLIIRNQEPVMVILGKVADTDIYLDKTRYASVVEVPGIKICQIWGNLHFANQESFCQNLSKITDLDPRTILKWKRKQEKLLKKKFKRQELQPSEPPHIITLEAEIKIMNEDDSLRTIREMNLANFLKNGSSVEDLKAANEEIVILIIDFSGVSQIDISAAKNLAQVQKEYEAAGIVMAFAALSEPALEIMHKCGATKDLSDDFFFHSVPDAVAFLSTPSQEQILHPPTQVIACI